MKQLQGWWAADLSPHLEISTPTGDVLDLIVDSGFNGQLMMPEPLLMQLGFVRRGAIDLELADGSVVRSETYSGFQMGAPASCGQSVQRVTFPPESTTCQVQPAGCGRTDLKTAILRRYYLV